MVGQTLRGQLKDLQQEKEALQNEEAKLAKRVAAKEAAQREMKKQKRKQEKLQREGEAEEGFPGKPASFGGGGGAREARERAAIVESKKELAFVQAKIYFTEKQITQVERQTKDEKQASSEPAKVVPDSTLVLGHTAVAVPVQGMVGHMAELEEGQGSRLMEDRPLEEDPEGDSHLGGPVRDSPVGDSHLGGPVGDSPVGDSLPGGPGEGSLLGGPGEGSLLGGPGEGSLLGGPGEGSLLGGLVEGLVEGSLQEAVLGRGRGLVQAQGQLEEPNELEFLELQANLRP
eukprot:gene8217-9766_t